MQIEIRQYEQRDAAQAAEIWNEVVEDGKAFPQMEKDMEVLRRGFRLLQLDYLGGHGSRGYGRIAFSSFHVQKMDPKTAEMKEYNVSTQKFEESKL